MEGRTAAERADRGIALGVRLSQRDPNGRFAASGSLCADEAAAEASPRTVGEKRPVAAASSPGLHQSSRETDGSESTLT